MSRSKGLTQRQKVMIELAKHPMDQPFSFRVKRSEEKGPIEKAENVLQGIRTELSRARRRLKNRGKVPANYKIIKLGIAVAKDDSDFAIVTVKRSDSPGDASPELEEFFEAMTERNEIDEKALKNAE